MVSLFNFIGLQFNTDNCHYILFFSNLSIINFTYVINISNLKSISMKIDLDAILRTKMNYYPHIEAMCRIFLKILGFMLRLTK